MCVGGLIWFCDCGISRLRYSPSHFDQVKAIWQQTSEFSGLSVLLSCKTGPAVLKGYSGDFLRWCPEQPATSRCAAEESSFPLLWKHKGEELFPVRGQAGPWEIIHRLLVLRRSLICGLLLVHQNDRTGLRELIIQQTRPSQIPSKGTVWFLSVHWLYKILKSPVHFKSLTKTQAWPWQEFLSHWVFLCVVYNNMQAWCQVLIY